MRTKTEPSTARDNSSSWKRSFTTTGICVDQGESKSRNRLDSRRNKWKYGFKTAGWNGKRRTKSWRKPWRMRFKSESGSWVRKIQTDSAVWQWWTTWMFIRTPSARWTRFSKWEEATGFLLQCRVTMVDLWTGKEHCGARVHYNIFDALPPESGKV